MKNNLAYSAYRQNNVSIESPQKLIAMLYEGVLRFTSLAKRSIDTDDIEKRVYYINRAIAIFTELLNSLDYKKGGQTSYYLQGLYMHQIQTLSQTNLTNEAKDLEPVINVTKGLLEAWKEENELD